MTDIYVQDYNRIIYRLRNFQGVIFGLAFCQQRRSIASVSDDRTCRIWRWCKPTESDDESSFTTETIKSGNGSFETLHTTYGHEARIWRVSFTKVGLITVGEV